MSKRQSRGSPKRPVPARRSFACKSCSPGIYPCQSEDHARFDDAEPIPGPTTERLAEAARRHGVVMVGSFFERRAPGLYHNTALIFDADGRVAGKYRKMHIPDDPLYYEKFYFTPGDLGFASFATRFGRSRHVRLLGPVVSRGRAADRADRRRRSSFIRRPSAGIPARKRNTAPASTRPGKP